MRERYTEKEHFSILYGKRWNEDLVRTLAMVSPLESMNMHDR